MLNDFTKYNLPQIDLGVKLPDFKIEKKHIDRLGLKEDVSAFDFLHALCLEGLENRVISRFKSDYDPEIEKYSKRMMYELRAFEELDFSSYLLITWDIVNHCRENAIPIGYGRGSAANSLVNYLIGITEIDSLRHELYFERFLNRTRAKFDVVDGIKRYNGSLLFDIDLDISFSDRERLVEWVETKYKNRVAKLPTIGTYTAKVLLKEVSKALLKINEDDAKEISDSIPVEFGKVFSIDKAIESSTEFKKFAEKQPEVIKISKKLHELNKQLGSHASAWVISADNLNTIMPVQLTKDKELSASYVMDDALNMAIKIDMLGLKCATLIDRTCKLVGINPLEIDTDDKTIYDNLKDLKTPYGLFQIAAGCNYSVLRHVKPQNISHLMAVVALARPGALQFIDKFADYVATGKFQSIHSIFDDILGETAGICIYQEQLVAMAHKIGFSLEEGENIRRVVGKKKLDEVQEWKSKVYEKIKEQGLEEKVADIFWKILEDSASYQFNKGHSASYATMAAATVYLKFKYPREFFLSCLRLAKEEAKPIEEIRAIQQEVKYFGLKLLGPHILKSKPDFEIEKEDIRFALNSIKSVSDKTLEKLRGFCHEFSNKFQIFQAAEECGINIAVLTNLIYAGCLDDYLTESRPKTVKEAQTFNILTPREKEKVLELGKEFNYNLMKILVFLKTYPNTEKPFLKVSRVATIKKKYNGFDEMCKQNSINMELCSYFFEKLLLGYCYSQDLVKILQKNYPDLKSIEEIKGELDDTKVIFGGEIVECETRVSKNKNKYFEALVSDGTETTKLKLMETSKRGGREINQFEYNNELNNFKPLEVGQVVVVTGRKKPDVVFCDKIVNQNVHIMEKARKFEENEVDKEDKK